MDETFCSGTTVFLKFANLVSSILDSRSMVEGTPSLVASGVAIATILLFSISPSLATTMSCIELFAWLSYNYPNQLVTLHCTHGVNRTGFISAILLHVFGGRGTRRWTFSSYFNFVV